MAFTRKEIELIAASAADALPGKASNVGMATRMLKSANLSDVADVRTSLINLGLLPIYTATQSLGGQRAVVAVDATHIDYADKDTSAHEGNVIGITMGAIASGAQGPVQVRLTITEPSWNWTPGGLIFLGNNGLLTQTPPTAGFVMMLGTALSAIAMFVNLGESVELA